MTLGLLQIGDKGQRFKVMTKDWPKNGWQGAGYAATREAADKMAAAFRLNPACTDALVADRKEMQLD